MCIFSSDILSKEHQSYTNKPHKTHSYSEASGDIKIYKNEINHESILNRAINKIPNNSKSKFEKPDNKEVIKITSESMNQDNKNRNEAIKKENNKKTPNIILNQDNNHNNSDSTEHINNTIQNIENQSSNNDPDIENQNTSTFGDRIADLELSSDESIHIEQEQMQTLTSFCIYFFSLYTVLAVIFINLCNSTL